MFLKYNRTNGGSMKKYIAEQAKKGIYLSTFHYFSEKSKVNDVLGELAEKGQGKYKKIINENDAISALVKESKQKTHI